MTTVLLLVLCWLDIWFFTEWDWSQESCPDNNILFLVWFTYLWPSLKNTAKIFIKICLIKYLTVLVKRFMTPLLICIIQKRRKIIQKIKCHSSEVWKPYFTGTFTISPILKGYLGSNNNKLCKWLNPGVSVVHILWSSGWG